MSLIVSVSGIRGIVGESLTPEVVLQFARAYGTVLDGGCVVLARDSRTSGEMFSAAAAAGLLAAGCEVTQLGVVMTPTVAHAIVRGGYAGGVTITASHNPAEYNGMKLLDRFGLAPDPASAERVARIREQRAFRALDSECKPLRNDPDAADRHVDAVFDAIETDLSPLKGCRVLLDSVNGAGCAATPGFLACLGLEVIHINGEPTGRFAHQPEPVAENLTDVCAAVRDSGASVGFVQDPDADRLVVIDESGRFIGEEYTLALATESVLSRHPGPVAANLSTSRMIDEIAARYGATVYRTPVGEAHVARAIMEHDCVIGGEGNGGVIDPRICPVRDSLSGISHVLQLMAATGKSVGELAAALPKYVIHKEKVSYSRERIDEALRLIESDVRENRREGVRIDTCDGIRIDEPDAWIHVRASNTEPIVRIIAEAPNEERCRALINRVREVARL